MARQFAWICTVALVLGSAAPAVALCKPGDQQKPAAQNPPKPGDPHDGQRQRAKWWADDPVKTELGITPKQSAAIEDIFSHSFPKLREKWQQLEKLDTELSNTIKANGDLATVSKQVEQVENLRAEVNKLRTIMIFRMHRELTADQRTKLEAYQAKRDAERKKQGTSPSGR